MFLGMSFCMVICFAVWCGITRGVAGMASYRMVLYGTACYCMVLHGIVWCGMLWYGIVLYCIVLYCIVLYCIVLYCVLLYSMVYQSRDINIRNTFFLRQKISASEIHG